ncbi:MAG: bifunctional 2-polyprenyl-6-hydroxyphenol methylase/3-demethylubiquinol 3-O-methyltransferase UbiG [Pseudomonadota bacterium]
MNSDETIASSTSTQANKKKSFDNVDASEVRKFNQLAAQWWDPEGVFKPLHQINPLRCQFIDQLLAPDSLAGKKVLDVGCGGGLLCEAMAARGAEVTGIDAGEDVIAVARMHALKSKYSIEYCQQYIEDLVSSHAQSFDVITCMEMLEHVPDPQSIVETCAALVKPNGHLFFSTINRNPKSFLFAILGAEYVLNWVPKGTHEYKKLIQPSELAAWCRDAKLEVTDIRGMEYRILSRQFELTNNPDVNYLLAARAF